MMLDPDSSRCPKFIDDYNELSPEDKHLFSLLVKHNLEVQRRSRQFCINDRQHTIHSGQTYTYYIDPSTSAAWGHYLKVLRDENFSGHVAATGILHEQTQTGVAVGVGTALAHGDGNLFQNITPLFRALGICGAFSAFDLRPFVVS